MAMPCRLGDLARFVGGRLLHAGYASNSLQALVPPALAAPTYLTFVREHVSANRVLDSGGILVTAGCVDTLPRESAAVLVDDLALACARAAGFLPVLRCASANVHPARHTRPEVEIAPGCVVAGDVRIGAGTVIAEGSLIGAGSRIGDHCRIDAGATIGEGVTLGNRVRIGANAAVGEDGFSFVHDGASWRRVPAFGSVVIGDDVELLSHAVVHAGVFGDTLIGSGCVLDSHVLIGHDADVGAGTAIAGHTAVAGAARIGRSCRIGGMVGIGEGIVLADGVTVAAMSMVSSNIVQPGASYAGSWPAQPRQRWWRQVARLRRAAMPSGRRDDA
ncbi:MAG: UDP-3-O-(3-hydroxymyristoyl)glucosamine N-acyltransferase [Gammaproteobacteria bacterium]